VVRAGQAVEPPHDDRIAVAQLIQQALKFGPGPAGTGKLLAEDLWAASLSEGMQL